MIRGDTVVAVMCPKLGAPSCVIAVENCVVVWLANCGVLKVLKNSARNCTVPVSLKPPTRVSLKMDMSILCWPGPYTTPRPSVPKPVAPSSCGGAQKAFLLKKLFRLICTGPGDSMSAAVTPGQSVAPNVPNAPASPKIPPALGSVKVNAGPDWTTTTPDAPHPLRIF